MRTNLRCDSKAVCTLAEMGDNPDVQTMTVSGETCASRSTCMPCSCVSPCLGKANVRTKVLPKEDIQEASASSSARTDRTLSMGDRQMMDVDGSSGRTGKDSLSLPRVAMKLTALSLFRSMIGLVFLLSLSLGLDPIRIRQPGCQILT